MVGKHTKRIFDGVFMHPAGCPRKLCDCEPLSRLASPEYESFMCCGETTEESRSVPTDRFRLCIRSTHETGVDLSVNLDERDVTDTASALIGALSSARTQEELDRLAQRGTAP